MRGFILGFALLVGTSAAAEVSRFDCDNDRIRVAVDARKTSIEILLDSPAPGALVFKSHGLVSRERVHVIGTSESAGFKLQVRKNQWGRVTVTGRDGHTIADELVFCGTAGTQSS